jgi:sporulation protein YlmC with PRC-barrel domain
MTALMRATAITKRPVVTLGGEAVAQVRDVVFDSEGGHVIGFTLSGRKRLSGPMKQSLPWQGVHALGHDAVMIASEGAFQEGAELVDRSEAKSKARDGNVLGARVLTDRGSELGSIVDVVVDAGASTADVVGYEIAPAKASGHRGRTTFIPRVETSAVSGEALVVPAAVADFAAEDLPGFETQVQAFRAHVRRGPDAVQ